MYWGVHAQFYLFLFFTDKDTQTRSLETGLSLQSTKWVLIHCFVTSLVLDVFGCS